MNWLTYLEYGIRYEFLCFSTRGQHNQWLTATLTIGWALRYIDLTYIFSFTIKSISWTKKIKCYSTESDVNPWYQNHLLYNWTRHNFLLILNLCSKISTQQNTLNLFFRKWPTERHTRTMERYMSIDIWNCIDWITDLTCSLQIFAN